MRTLTIFVLPLFAVAAIALAQQPGKPAAHGKASTSTKAAADGQKLFEEQCSVCHYPRSAAKKIGPGLKGLSKRATFADGKKVGDDALRAWVEKGGKDMPGFKETLTAEQIRDLVAYLKSL